MMVHAENPNLSQLLEAVKKLTPLLDQIVFLGGCATGLLLTDPAAAPVRATLDVDAIIEVASYAEFSVVEQQLRGLGFRQPMTEGAPICRWISGDVIFDLMPTDPSILGFSNRWYRPAIENSHRVAIGAREIRVVTAPYFLATKLEAFRGRGKNDYHSSHDLEDIIVVMDGRPELADEVSLVPADLQHYLSHEFRSLLSSPDFRDSLPGHLLPDEASQQRLPIIISRIQRMAEGWE